MKKLLRKLTFVAMALFTFVACEDVPEPYDVPGNGTNKPGHEETIGTLENPITVAAALELIEGYSSGGSSKTDAYVKGIISSVQSYNANYFSITYYISDDGSANNQVQCYSGKGLNGADFSSKDDLKPGTQVIVKGKLKKFVNASGVTTAEIDQSSQIVWMGDVPETPEANPKGEGTLENPYNAAAANREAAKLADKQASEQSYYIYGKVAQIVYNYGEGKYPQTADYYISEDGNNANTFYVYASKYLGNTDYTSGDVLKVGDDVIIYGQLYNYGGTYETATNKSYLYSLNGVTAGSETPQPGGEVKTVTVAEFISAEVSDDVWYQMTGKVTNLQDGDIYGNFDLEDETGSVYVYGLLSEKGGAKKLFQELVAAKGIKEGSTITIIGNRGVYNDKIEVKNAYFVSIEGGSVTPEPQPGGDAKIVTIAEFNAAEVSDAVWYQLTGTVKNLKDDDQYGNFDLEDETGSVYVYGLLSGKGGFKKQFQELAAAKGIKNGSKLTIIGNRGDYQGKIEVTNAYFVSIEGGSDTPDPDPQPSGNGFGTLSGNVLTLVAADLGVDNGTEPGTVKLVDGTTLTFDGGGNSNTPKYYTSGTSIRMYPKNSMTVKANGKTIQSIILTCSSQSGTLCNASGDVTATPGSVSISGDDVNVSSINSSSTSITNSSTTTGAPSQLRFSKMVITYAE